MKTRVMIMPPVKSQVVEERSQGVPNLVNDFLVWVDVEAAFPLIFASGTHQSCFARDSYNTVTGSVEHSAHELIDFRENFCSIGVIPRSFNGSSFCLIQSE